MVMLYEIISNETFDFTFLACSLNLEEIVAESMFGYFSAGLNVKSPCWVWSVLQICRINEENENSHPS